MRTANDFRPPHRHEVTPMRRLQRTPLAILAGLVLTLAGCSGESPTGPKTDGGGGGTGTCTATVSLAASSVTAFAGTGVVIRATVTADGKPVPDGTSVLFTADFGVFPDTGLPSISKVTQNGYADVIYGSLNSGIGKVTATYTCASAKISIQFDGIPTQGPFVSSINPTIGSCAGGETVTITGGRFTGSDPTKLLVTFGGSPASIVSQSDASITVLTPSRVLASGVTSEIVDVVVTVDAGSPGAARTAARKFTYSCPQRTVQVGSVSPNHGKPAGGETVTVSGNGFFGSSTASTPVATIIARTRATFGGNAAVIQSISDTSLSVLTPRYTLLDPNVPETVDVAVTADLGLASQSVGTLAKAFTYSNSSVPDGTPTIFSISPSSGPRDTSTRVTIFGQNFTFPSQVFFTGGCRVEASVVSVSSTQIVALAPQVTGGNSCLIAAGAASGVAAVSVVNPATGVSADNPSAVSFRYYSCPSSINGISPSAVPFDQTTKVAITGDNFEEPVAVTMRLGGGATQVSLNVVSVSASTIIVEIPPLASVPGGAVSCSNQSIALTVTELRNSCPSITNLVGVPLAYEVRRPTITSVTPGTMPQAGGIPVTVTGTNFAAPMTVKVGSTTISNVTVANSTTLSFVAPPVKDSDFNTQPCGASGGGTQKVPTAFDVTVTNAATTCDATANSALVYSPTDTSCTLSIVTAGLPSATLCSAYSTTVVAGGGVGPYTFQATGLPNGLSISTAGVISGTPALLAPGVGGSQSYAVVVTAFDTTSKSATATLNLLVTDPGGPFVITPQTTSITMAAGATQVYTAGPGIGPITFTPSPITVSPAPVGGTLTATALGNTVTIQMGNPKPTGGPWTITFTATDTACGGVSHTAARTLTVN